MAVWPFENDTGDGGQDALADGLTQQIISALGRFGELRVLARGVTKTYKGRFQNAADFGRALGVDYFVDGNLRRDGELARIDIQLSDARTGAQVWSKTFKASMRRVQPAGRTGRDIGPGERHDRQLLGRDRGCRIQAHPEQAQRGADALRVHRTRRDRNADRRHHSGAGRKSAGLPGAVDARRAAKRRRLGGSRSGLQQPEDLGLSFADGRELAASKQRLYLADMAVEAANRAVEIAPNDAFVRGLVARAAWMACQPDLLRIETMRAIELNPNDPQNLGPLGNLMAYAGFWDEGVALAEKGIALTAPSTPRWWWWAIAKRAFAHGDYARGV